MVSNTERDQKYTASLIQQNAEETVSYPAGYNPPPCRQNPTLPPRVLSTLLAFTGEANRFASTANDFNHSAKHFTCVAKIHEGYEALGSDYNFKTSEEYHHACNILRAKARDARIIPFQDNAEIMSPSTFKELQIAVLKYQCNEVYNRLNSHIQTGMHYGRIYFSIMTYPDDIDSLKKWLKDVNFLLMCTKIHSITKLMILRLYEIRRRLEDEFHTECHRVKEEYGKKAFEELPFLEKMKILEPVIKEFNKRMLDGFADSTRDYFKQHCQNIRFTADILAMNCDVLGLTEIPEEINDVNFPRLKILDLSNNHIYELPDEILKPLRHVNLNLSNNRIRRKLTWDKVADRTGKLNLSNNQITYISTRVLQEHLSSDVINLLDNPALGNLPKSLLDGTPLEKQSLDQQVSERQSKRYSEVMIDIAEEIGIGLEMSSFEIRLDFERAKAEAEVAKRLEFEKKANDEAEASAKKEKTAQHKAGWERGVNRINKLQGDRARRAQRCRTITGVFVAAAASLTAFLSKRFG